MVKRVSAPCASCGAFETYRRFGKYRCPLCGERWRPTENDLRIEALERRWGRLESVGRWVFFIGNVALIPFCVTALATLGRAETALYVTAIIAFAGFGCFIISAALLVIGRMLRRRPNPELKHLYHQRQEARSQSSPPALRPSAVDTNRKPRAARYVLRVGRGSLHLAWRWLSG